MTALVPLTRNQKIVLKNAPIDQIAEELLGAIPQDDAPDEFPKVPTPLTASKEIRDALRTLSQTFNGTTVTERRALTEEECGAIGKEMESLQKVLKLLNEREDQVKEIIRTHQDVEAEQKGLAFPKDVVLNGNVVAKATERDPKGHYILATKGHPQVTEVPGATVKFSNQYTSGKITKDLGWIERAYQAGEIDEETYKACTVVRRVPTEERIRAYALRTGDAGILANVVKRGRPFSSMYLRQLNKS